MESAVLGLHFLLAAVFAVAGVGKLLDLAGSRRAVSAFGVPRRWADVAGTLLPFAELAVAVALLIQQTARWGALAALVLLIAFLVGLVRALSQERAPDCHCFGQLHSEPVGRRTVARNAVLAILAGVLVAVGPGPGLGEWLSARTGLELAALGLAIGFGIAGLALRLFRARRASHRHVGAARARARASRLTAGAPAPSFRLPSVNDGERTLGELLAHGQPLVLLFLHPGCGPCRSLLPEIGRWQTALAGQLKITPISSGREDKSRLDCAEHGITEMLLQDRSEVAHAYDVRATPSAVVVDPHGTLARAPVSGAHAVEALIRVALRGTASQPRSPTYQPSSPTYRRA